MKMLWKFLKLFLTALAVLTIALALLLPHLASTGKLQGNQAARLYCRIVVKDWREANINNTNFNFFTLPDDIKLRTVGWLNPQWDFWIKTNFLWQNENSKQEIVIVCGKEFNNVHKPGFWSSFFPNPAHAVAYSDGTIGLISPEEFTHLNRNGFISTEELATNSEFKVYKK